MNITKTSRQFPHHAYAEGRMVSVVHLADEDGEVGSQTIVLAEFHGTVEINVEHGVISVVDEFVPELIKMLQLSVKSRQARERKAKALNKSELKKQAAEARQPRAS